MTEDNQWDTSHSLLDRLKITDDQQSWKEFINFYENFILRITKRMGISEADAQELFQKISVILWEKIPKGKYDKNKGKFRAWLASIIKNESRNFLRDSNRRKQLENENNSYIVTQLIDDDSNEELEQSIEREWINHVSHAAWDSIKHRFHEKAKDVFLMTLEGKDVSDIAEKLGIKNSTVYVYRNRIHKNLEEEITRTNERFS